MAITVSAALLESLAPAGTSQEALDAAADAADGDVNAAALVLWWDYRSDMMSSPLKWAADGDYSEDRTKNVDEVNKIVAGLEQTVGVGVSASGLDPTLPMLASAPVRRLGREDLYTGDPLVSAAPTTITNTSNDELWAKLQGIADAVFQTTLTSFVDSDVDLIADTPFLIDVSSAIGEVVIVEVLDSGAVDITATLDITVATGLVTVESSGTLSDNVVTILGHAA